MTSHSELAGQVAYLSPSLTLADAQEALKPMVSAVLDGTVEPLEVSAALKFLQVAAESADKKIFEIVMEKINDHGKDKAKVNGVTFTPATKTTLDYSKNKKWVELKKQIDLLETVIDSVTESGTPIDHDGICIDPVPVKSSTVYFKRSLDK